MTEILLHSRPLIYHPKQDLAPPGLRLLIKEVRLHRKTQWGMPNTSKKTAIGFTQTRLQSLHSSIGWWKHWSTAESRHWFHSKATSDLCKWCHYHTTPTKVAKQATTLSTPNWGSRLTSPRGRVLLKTLESNNFRHLSSREPTYWPTDRNKLLDLVDFCITKGIPLQLRRREVLPRTFLGSFSGPRHTFNPSNSLRTPTQALQQETDWDTFRHLLNERLLQ
jgi:hypothetical protein